MVKGIRTEQDLFQYTRKLQKFDYLKHLPWVQILQLFLRVELLKNCFNQTIFSENAPAEHVYFIQKGKYNFTKNIIFTPEDPALATMENPLLMFYNYNKELHFKNSKDINLSEFHEGEFFGDTDIVLNQKRYANAVCSETDSLVFKMGKEDFFEFVYNQDYQRQNIQKFKTQQQNYIELKFKGIQDCILEHSSYLTQIQELRGISGYRDEKRVTYPRKVPDKELQKIKGRFITNNPNYLYNQIFQKCKNDYVNHQLEIQERREEKKLARKMNKIKSISRKKKFGLKSHSFEILSENCRKFSTANPSKKQQSIAQFLKYRQKLLHLDKVNESRLKKKPWLKLGDYYVQKMMKGYREEYGIAENEKIQAGEIQNLIRSKNQFVIRYKREQEVKKDKKRKHSRIKDKLGEVIKKMIKPIKDNISLVNKMEKFSKYKIKKTFTKKYRKGSSPPRETTKYELKTRPDNFNSQSRLNILTRKIFQNIHEGSGFYPVSTKIMNSRFQPKYRKLIMDKANKSFKYLKGRDKESSFNQTMYYKSLIQQEKITHPNPPPQQEPQNISQIIMEQNSENASSDFDNFLIDDTIDEEKLQQQNTQKQNVLTENHRQIYDLIVSKKNFNQETEKRVFYQSRKKQKQNFARASLLTRDVKALINRLNNSQ